tara:strand:- start:500 stop:787 length:288 start_codon:yes stop_codon:yes gene_type:complete
VDKDKSGTKKLTLKNFYLIFPTSLAVLLLLTYWSFRLVHKGLSYLLFNEIIKLNYCDLFVSLLMIFVIALAVVEMFIRKNQVLKKENTEHQGSEK